MLRSLRAHSSHVLRLSPLRRDIHSLPKSSGAPSASPEAEVYNRRTRGGHDLGARYKRLEASLRQKGALAQAIEDSPASQQDVSSLSDAGELPKPSTTPKVEMFKGFVVPEEPQEPGPEGR
jgi:hypothetical protein